MEHNTAIVNLDEYIKLVNKVAEMEKQYKALQEEHTLYKKALIVAVIPRPIDHTRHMEQPYRIEKDGNGLVMHLNYRQPAEIANIQGIKVVRD